MTILGLVFVIVSSFVLGRSFAALGDCHSARPKAKRLITSGPYTKIRHPIYLFAFLLWVGCFLVIAPKLVWIALLPVPLQVFRARREEQILAHAFGPLWQKYKQQTWF